METRSGLRPKSDVLRLQLIPLEAADLQLIMKVASRCSVDAGGTVSGADIR